MFGRPCLAVSQYASAPGALCGLQMCSCKNCTVASEFFTSTANRAIREFPTFAKTLKKALPDIPQRRI